MYFAKKSEYNDIREKSFLQWLDEMEKHDDVAVRCGVKLAREYRPGRRSRSAPRFPARALCPTTSRRVRSGRTLRVRLPVGPRAGRTIRR